MANCSPKAGDPAPAYSSACEAAFELRQAYFQLIAGKNRVMVRFNERWTEYGKGNAELLKQEVRRYEALCANPDASMSPVIGAVRAGPYTSQPGVHPGLGLNYPRRRY